MPSNPNSKTDPTCKWLLTLPDQIDAAAERGQPVVLRLEREPDAGVRRLMATLGVPVEVQPVNHDVRVAEGADGGIVVMSAWCATCKLDSTPNPRGECVFCGTVIVDEDRLSAREMREQIAGRGRSEVQRRTKAPSRVRPVEAPQPPGLTRRVNGSGTDGGPRGDTTTVADVDGPKYTPRGHWTRERIIEAIQTWAAEHGRPPVGAEWALKGDGRPTIDTVKTMFGSWADGIEAAGFDRPTRVGRGDRDLRRLQPAGLSEPDVPRKQSRAPHATTPPPGNNGETSGPLNSVEPEPEPASVNQQMRLRYLELLIAKAEEQLSPDDALLDRIERFMEIA